VDPYLAAEADRILGLTAKRARKKRRRKPRTAGGAAPSQTPQINVTVNIADTHKRPGSVRPGRPGDSDLVANGRSRIRRIGPSPG
jgi:hypothetical protein